MFSRRKPSRDVRRGVLLLVPVLLEILQQEVAIADLAQLGSEGEALAQFLAMLLDVAIAIVDVGLGQDVAAAQAQVVGAAIGNTPEFDVPRNRPGNAQKIAAVIFELRAFRQAPQAHVVQAHGPIGSHRAVLDAQQLVGGPIGKELVAEYAVMTDLDMADEERRVVQVCGERRPIENRRVLDVQQVVLRHDQLLVIDRRLAGLGVDQRLAAERVCARGLVVFIGSLAHLQAIAGNSQAAGSDKGVLGQEAALAHLLQDVGVQADLAFIARRRREHVGRKHRAHLVSHVVIHAVGIDDAVALAEDDVAFHVHFQRFVLLHREGRIDVGLLRGHGPDHQPVGRQVERQRSAAHAGDVLAGRQALDDHVHALVDDGLRLVRQRVLFPLGLHRHVAPRIDADPHRARRKGRGPRRRHGPRGGRRQGGVGRRGDVLHLIHAGLPQHVGVLRIAQVHAALIDARQHVGPAGHVAGIDLHVADRKEAAEPFFVVDLDRLAIGDQADADITFEIGDDLRASVRGGRGMVDPDHRFLADRPVVALQQLAFAPQQPHFIRALLPSIGRLGLDHNRLDVIAVRQADLCRERCRQEKARGHEENPKRQRGPCTESSAHTATMFVAQRRGGTGRRRSFARSFQQTSVLACLAKR